MKVSQIYKCNICGNIVQVTHVGGGRLVCCGQPMEKLEEKTDDVGQEKHKPVVEPVVDSVNVKVGSVPHPMEEQHYIEWVDLIADDKVYKIFLNPGKQPEAEFAINGQGVIKARAYCNIHGLWIS